jgi:hypothetical protein
MTCCDFIDYSDRDGSLVPVLDYQTVTLGNIERVKQIVPIEQQGQIEEGDYIAVCDIDNSIEGIKGKLTIWYNKDMACIDINNCVIWGCWDENEKLVLTEDYAEAKDFAGKTVKGLLAYNTHGVKGIYSDGKFYTIVRDQQLDAIKPIMNDHTCTCNECVSKADSYEDI